MNVPHSIVPSIFLQTVTWSEVSILDTEDVEFLLEGAVSFCDSYTDAFDSLHATMEDMLEHNEVHLARLKWIFIANEGQCRSVRFDIEVAITVHGPTEVIPVYWEPEEEANFLGR